MSFPIGLDRNPYPAGGFPKHSLDCLKDKILGNFVTLERLTAGGVNRMAISETNRRIGMNGEFPGFLPGNFQESARGYECSFVRDPQVSSILSI